MPSNAQTILDDLLEHERLTTALHLSANSFFGLFTTEQILKNYGLSYEELESGIVDGGGDGGVDSIYTFVNGVLVTEESDFENIKQNVLITLIIIQSKTTAGFAEDPILRLESTIRDLFDLDHNLANYEKTYNAKLLRAVEIFRKTYSSLSPKLPEFHFVFYYATKGDQVHPNVEVKTKRLRDISCHLFTQSGFSFHFLGAKELLTLSRKSRAETLTLQVSEVMSTLLEGTICLVRLRDYYDFIHDAETGELRGWLFEENVRDYEGKNVEVNREIRLTLEQPKPNEDFWWLNNGITIVAAKAPMASKTLTITDPKIVNGLQTSMEIYNFFRLHPDEMTDRNILVRAIVTNNEQTRNDIIKATNSQSAIKAASLRAFSEIHYKIEQYFNAHSLYYDRRKNYYKNLKKPKDQIVSIPYLAQAVAAIILQRPNDSRGRPINLIKTESLYKRVFDEEYPIELFLECARFMKSVDAFLTSSNAPEYIQGHEVNVRFHLAMFASAMLAKQTRITPRRIKKLGLGNPDASFLTKCLKQVWKLLEKTKKEKDVDEDRVAKSPEFDLLLKEHLRRILKTKEVAF